MTLIAGVFALGLHQLDPFSIVVAGTARMAEVVLFQMTYLMHQRREYMRSVSLLKVRWVERNLVCDLCGITCAKPLVRKVSVGARLALHGDQATRQAIVE